MVSSKHGRITSHRKLNLVKTIIWNILLHLKAKINYLKAGVSDEKTTNVQLVIVVISPFFWRQQDYDKSDYLYQTWRHTIRSCCNKVPCLSMHDIYTYIIKNRTLTFHCHRRTLVFGYCFEMFLWLIATLPWWKKPWHYPYYRWRVTCVAATIIT